MLGAGKAYRFAGSALVEIVQDIAALKSHGFYNRRNPINKSATSETVATKADIAPKNCERSVKHKCQKAN